MKRSTLAGARVKRKVLLVANTGWYLYNFRQSLAAELAANGFQPVFISPRDEFSEKLAARGFAWHELGLQRASLNPLSALVTIRRLAVIYREERPEIVHHFTPKIVFFGTLAARFARVRGIVNSITGLGHLADDKRLRYRILFAVEKVLYRLALAPANVKVVLQNPDDLAELLRLRLVRREKCVLIQGSGVDTGRYRPAPAESSDPPAVLFASRLLEAKGIYELMEAAREVKKEYPAARFWVAGAPDPGNPTSVTAEQVEGWKKEGIADFLGHVDPIDDLIRRSTIVALPSYREGLPKILLEANSMGRSVVTTDVPGCREVVRDGENGFLVPPRDARALAAAILRLLRDDGLRERMGAAGRSLVMDKFSAERVNRETRAIYQDIAIH